jgi:hypothetical protein
VKRKETIRIKEDFLDTHAIGLAPIGWPARVRLFLHLRACTGLVGKQNKGLERLKCAVWLGLLVGDGIVGVVGFNLCCLC